ncbi:MAG: hypothetical protein NTZ17_09735 [Phycisphaerae bacterium]|nr:hypothetical protein [Phycisphaerae bacterium]
MKKSLIFAICFILPLAGCRTDGDAHRTAAIPTPLTEGGPSDAAPANEKDQPETSKEAGVSSPLDEALELQSGIYGIPFGGTTEELLKWCADNNMTIGNPTEKDVRKDAQRAIQRVRDLKEAYDLEAASLTPLERELLKLAQGYNDTGDVLELAKVAAAKEKLDVLKNPTVSYEGQKYYLEPVHKGMEVRVDDERKVCKDERICRTAYRLTLTPTDKSEKMGASGLTSIAVLFHGDAGKELRAYATLAILGGNAQRSANTQFQLVSTALREKYGTPKFVPRGRSNNDYGRSYEVIAGDMYELAGIDCGISFFFENAGILWARNLIILGDIESPGTALRGSAFWLLYWDHKAASRIFDVHKEALQDFQKNYHEKKREALAQIAFPLTTGSAGEHSQGSAVSCVFLGR